MTNHAWANEQQNIPIMGHQNSIAHDRSRQEITLGPSALWVIFLQSQSTGVCLTEWHTPVYYNKFIKRLFFGIFNAF